MPAPSPTPPGILLAEWASLHSHLLWIYDGAVETQGRGDVAAHDLTAWLIRRGWSRVRLRGQTWTASAGEWFFPPPGERRQEFSADAQIVSVRFRARWPTGEDFYQAGLGLALSAAAHPELLRAARPLVKLVARHFPHTTIDLMQAPADLAVHARLQTLYAIWFETVVSALAAHGVLPSRMGKIDARLLLAVRRLDKQPLASRLSESELAAGANLSVSQLNRLFVRQFGVSSRGYFERRRHQHAETVLESSSATIKEIAFELGFSSLPHFSAWFRREHGVPPRRFRAAAAGRRADGKKA